MLEEMKKEILSDLRRQYERNEALPEFPRKKEILHAIMHKIENIDEYVRYRIARVITSLLDSKGKRVEERFLLDMIPDPMRTEAFVDIIRNVSPEACQLKGYPLYDKVHQQLWESLGFTEKLPTFEEIYRLRKQRDSLSPGQEGYDEVYDELNFMLHMKEYKAGAVDEYNEHIDLEQDIIDKYAPGTGIYTNSHSSNTR